MTAREAQQKKDNSKGENRHTDSLRHDQIRMVHDNSAIGVLGLDADGMICYANELALSYANSSFEQVLGRPILSLFEDSSPGKPNEALLMQSREIVDQEFRIKSLPDDKWVLISSRVIKDADGIVQDYIFIRNISRQKKRENLFAYLNNAATALSRTRDTAGALEQISQFIVPRFANWFTIDQLIENHLELLLLKHEDPQKIEWAYQYRRKYPPDLNSASGPAHVIKTGKSGFVSVVTDEMVDMLINDPVQKQEVKKIGLRSVIIAPMFTNGQVAGLVNFISSSKERHFDETDLEFAENFANLIGLVLENTRLNEAAAWEITLRKKAEERFHFLTDAIPHKLWTSDPEGHATYYNRQWHDYAGIQGFEALKENIWDLIFPQDRIVAENAWPRAIASGEPTEIEHRLKRSDGDYRWHLSRFLPYKDPVGQVALWVGTSTDIHEQKKLSMDLAATNEELSAANEQLALMNEEISATNEELASANEELRLSYEELSKAQQNLQQSEKLFRSVALNMPNSLITVINKDHRYVMIEGELMKKMGYNRMDYEGKHPGDISAERYQVAKPLYDRVLQGEKFSLERNAENGDQYIMHFVPLKNNVNEVNSALIIALDVTDIKRTEEKSAMLAAIVASSDDAIISKTLQSVITSWNDSAERMFGYTAKEMVGKSIYKIIPPDLHYQEPDILARAKKGERIAHFETKRLAKNGRLLDVSLSISPIKDANGKIIGLSKIARDITEKKQEEQRKNDFIGMVSHELRTPLTSLNAIIQVANTKLQHSGDSFLIGAMGKANVQLKRMTGMINGFLNIARLEGGKILVEKQSFDLHELLCEIVEENNLIVSTHPVKLVESTAVVVDADRDRINSVISNLISNAIKYSPRGKPIEIRSWLDGGRVLVSVKDEGMGIKEHDINKVFDRYYRVQSHDMKLISGFGIGLFLSAEIIKRHEGDIWVESGWGKGSTFFFSLPLSSGLELSGH